MLDDTLYLLGLAGPSYEVAGILEQVGGIGFLPPLEFSAKMHQLQRRFCGSWMQHKYYYDSLELKHH